MERVDGERAFKSRCQLSDWERIDEGDFNFLFETRSSFMVRLLIEHAGWPDVACRCLSVSFVRYLRVGREGAEGIWSTGSRILLTARSLSSANFLAGALILPPPHPSNSLRVKRLTTGTPSASIAARPPSSRSTST